jgi:hypothetical protein
MPTSAEWNGRLVMMSFAIGDVTEDGDVKAVGEAVGVDDPT